MWASYLYDIFVNSNCVDTRWQYYSTHLHKSNTQNNKNKKRTTQITNNLEERGPCPVFASFTLAFDLQQRKKQRKTSVMVRKPSVMVQCTFYQNTHTIQDLHTNTHTHTHTNTVAPNDGKAVYCCTFMSTSSRYLCH